ncbi:hypothetical protein [Mesorhizobium sp.]|uniref:hypothetical protein n=1 Tax=Mesorhizobium sp. TaxID=1871066 RepID=UPI000FE8A82C|nr:hypothetical protein [Mesorhizobium sp.]RWP72921.1 MAG: hypothetical protein EOR10_25535 [Mesorhizobium sp.]RWQ62342.1 MAG: hypothetical protein EOS86_30565 [Mesorhizobium sp.]
MSSRYATIIIDDDGREVISAIGQFEGAPDMRRGRVEQVSPGVRIGMVRGGPVDAAGGFGFPLAGVGDNAVSVVRAALKAVSATGKAKSGSTAVAKPEAASRPRKPKAKRAGKRAKSRKRPTPAVKKTAKPEIVALAGAAG